MPITIPAGLPAKQTLAEENIFIMENGRAKKQDIRPLRVAILNLMPEKIETETHLLRMLSNTPLQADITLLHAGTHQSKNTSAEHLLAFYKTWEQIKNEKFDGLIVTGAPVEHLPWEEVTYWEELKQILDWSQDNVFSTLHICWGAQAGLYHHYGIDKYPAEQKVFGVFPHRVLTPNISLLRGFGEEFLAPASRHTEVRREDIARIPELQLLAESDEAGVLLAADKNFRKIFVTGHFEYDGGRLDREYKRDLGKGLSIAPPKNYYPDNDPQKKPLWNWSPYAHLFYSNWLNYCVYQETPFDLSHLNRTTPGTDQA